MLKLISEYSLYLNKLFRNVSQRYMEMRRQKLRKDISNAFTLTEVEM